MNPEDAFQWADEAVGFLVREIRPDLASSWRGIVPSDIVPASDDWMKMANRMVERFNNNTKSQITISAPTRRANFSKRLILFAITIADAAA